MIVPKKFRDEFTSIISLSQYDYNIADDITIFLQNGSGPVRTVIYKFIDTGGLYKYTIREEEINEDIIHINIISKDKIQCMSILINKKVHLATLISMSETGKCVSEGLNKSIGKSGTKILKAALNILINKKNKYKIKRIILKDKSHLQCNNCKNPIKLAQIRTVLKGEPWFSSFGFKPIQDKEYAIQSNINVLKKLKTSEINIEKIIKLSIKNNDSTEQININEILKIAKNNIYLKDFISRLSLEFNKYCCFISHLLEHIFSSSSKTGLVDLYNSVFYLDI